MNNIEIGPVTIIIGLALSYFLFSWWRASKKIAEFDKKLESDIRNLNLLFATKTVAGLELQIGKRYRLKEDEMDIEKIPSGTLVFPTMRNGKNQTYARADVNGTNRSVLLFIGNLVEDFE